MEITHSTFRSFNFENLIPELRNLIYDAYLDTLPLETKPGQGQHRQILLNGPLDSSRSVSAGQRRINYELVRSTLPLLQTSRWIRHEVLSLMWRTLSYNLVLDPAQFPDADHTTRVNCEFITGTLFDVSRIERLRLHLTCPDPVCNNDEHSIDTFATIVSALLRGTPRLRSFLFDLTLTSPQRRIPEEEHEQIGRYLCGLRDMLLFPIFDQWRGILDAIKDVPEGEDLQFGGEVTLPRCFEGPQVVWQAQELGKLRPTYDAPLHTADADTGAAIDADTLTLTPSNTLSRVKALRLRWMYGAAHTHAQQHLFTSPDNREKVLSLLKIVIEDRGGITFQGLELATKMVRDTFDREVDGAGWDDFDMAALLAELRSQSGSDIVVLFDVNLGSAGQNVAAEEHGEGEAVAEEVNAELED